MVKAIDGITYLKRVDPVLAEVIKRVPRPQTKRRRANHFRALVQTIISQQLSDKAADTLIVRFRKLFPRKIFPGPKDVLKVSDHQIRAVGLSYSKASFIKEVAKTFENRQLNFRKLRTLPEEQVIAELVKIKGIGRWTAEMFLLFSLEHPDIFSHGDIGLRNAIHRLYGFKKTPTVKQIEKITAKWSPHRSLASRYLWASLNIKK